MSYRDYSKDSTEELKELYSSNCTEIENNTDEIRWLNLECDEIEKELVKRGEDR